MRKCKRLNLIEKYNKTMKEYKFKKFKITNMIPHIG